MLNPSTESLSESDSSNFTTKEDSNNNSDDKDSSAKANLHLKWVLIITSGIILSGALVIMHEAYGKNKKRNT